MTTLQLLLVILNPSVQLEVQNYSNSLNIYNSIHKTRQKIPSITHTHVTHVTLVRHGLPLDLFKKSNINNKNTTKSKFNADKL